MASPSTPLHVHGYASRESIREIEAAIWSELGVAAELPASLGVVRDGARSEPLAIVQLILLHGLLVARQHHDDDVDAASRSASSG